LTCSINASCTKLSWNYGIILTFHHTACTQLSSSSFKRFTPSARSIHTWSTVPGEATNMSYTSHHVWFLASAWGHITSANATIARMLQLNPQLVVTVVHHAFIVDRVNADLRNYGDDIDLTRIKVVSAGKKETLMKGVLQAVMQEMIKGFLDTIKDIEKRNVEGWPRATKVVLDQYGGNFVLPGAREVVREECKVFMHWTGGATTSKFQALGGLSYCSSS
jgi:hypothetical protein